MGGTYHSTSDGRARRTVVVRGFSVATLSLFVVRQVSICSRVPSGGIKEVSSSSHSVCPSSFVIIVGRRRGAAAAGGGIGRAEGFGFGRGGQTGGPIGFELKLSARSPAPLVKNS